MAAIRTGRMASARSNSARAGRCTRACAWRCPICGAWAARSGVNASLPCVLHYRQGQGQARLLLGARLSQGKIRTESGRRHQPGLWPGHSRLGDGETHTRSTSATRLKVSEALTAPYGGTTRFSALWQADRTQHSAHGADRVYRALHARVVRLRHRRRVAPTGRRHGAGQRTWSAWTRSAKIDRAHRDSDGRLRRRPLQHLLPDGTARDGARGLRLWRAGKAGLSGAVRRSRNHRESRRSRTTPARGRPRRRFGFCVNPEPRHCSLVSS